MTDRFLPSVAQLLSSTGLFYLIAVLENDPGEFLMSEAISIAIKRLLDTSPSFSTEDIIRFLEKRGLEGQSCLSTRAGNERLSMLRFHRRQT